MDNALRHSAGSWISVTFHATHDSFQLSVSDDGKGIPAKHHERAFAPFERLNPALDPKGGTGLGLAIVRELAAALGGQIELGPGSDGRGACFRLTIPLGDPHA